MHIAIIINTMIMNMIKQNAGEPMPVFSHLGNFLPHLGQNVALVDTALPHEGHFIKSSSNSASG